MAGLDGEAMEFSELVEESAEQHKIAGNDCMRNNNFTAAIEHYRRGLKLDPTNSVLNCNISQAFLNKKEYVEAEKYANMAIKHRENYVKGYYRAARAALGRHNVYDSMLYLADGVSKCDQGLEDLFAMARELSPEFETSLRRCQKAEPEKKAETLLKPSTSQAGEKSQKAADGVDEREDWQRKLDEKAEKKRKLEEKKKLLKLQNKEVDDELERETREYEQLQKESEIKEQEKRAREKKEQEKRDRERKEQEKRDRERKEQEKRDREKKEQERRERERKEQERRDREKKEQEKRDQERKEQEKKQRERMEQERREREHREQEKREREKKEAAIKARELEVQNNLKEGSMALIKGLCRKAIDYLDRVLETIKTHFPAENLGFSDLMDIVVVEFLYSESLILSGEYQNILKAMKVLDNLDVEGKHNKFPAIFLLLGKAFVRLNRWNKAQEPLRRGLAFLSRGTSFLCYPWPGTNEVIEATERKFLKEALRSELLFCQIYHKPDAVCFHENCLTLSQHIIPSRNIFFSDPDFIGFVSILCQENCHIYFHLSCWKDFKEHLSIEKLSDKDFLGRGCLTPDCKKKWSLEESAVIVKVVIIGPDGEEKSKCECAPPLPSVLPSLESTRTPSKIPLKRPRKKELEKKHDKKTRTSKGDVQTNSLDKKGSSQGQQYADALSKLEAARENNFGYDNTAADATKVMDEIIEAPPMKQNEEFIYSYFLEIFKKNGHMSIFDLQEHWEANRELLPELEPALVTHTDLVKFLLDTDRFAVVQDMIGIAGDLPKISAVVESKSEILPVVYEWQFSAATLQEASQTLSFNSPCERDEDIDLRAEDFNKHDFLSTCDKSSSSSSYHSVYENDNKEEETPCSGLVGSSNASIPFHHTSNHDEAIYVNGYCSTGIGNDGSISGSYHTSDKNPNLPLAVEPSKAPGSNPILDIIKPVNVKNRLSNLPNLPTPLEKDVSVELPNKMKELDITNETNNNCKISNLSSNFDHVAQDVQSVGQSSARAALKEWKPRAKLLEWACVSFPDESKGKLWEALTIVRAKNNYSLSGLSFDAIKERLAQTLHQP